MENKRDYYEVLGVSKEADSSAIKKAYRKLAKKYHPDTNAGNAEAEKRFKEISEAYAVLGDEEKKKLYDEFGHIAFEPGFNADAARAQKQYGYENFGSDNSRMVIGSTILTDQVEMTSSEICLEICFAGEQKEEISTAEDSMTAADFTSSFIRAETMSSTEIRDFIEHILEKGRTWKQKFRLPLMRQPLAVIR
mgnify:CR=1 FL=1